MAGAGAFQTPKARHGRCGLGAILGTVTCKDDEKWGTLTASVFPWKKTTQIYSDDNSGSPNDLETSQIL